MGCNHSTLRPTPTAPGIRSLASPTQSQPQLEETTTTTITAATRAAIEAEVARVKSLSPDEHKAVGRKYTDPEALFAALEAGGGDATLVLRASWVKRQRGCRFPKRGEALPPEAKTSSSGGETEKAVEARSTVVASMPRRSQPCGGVQWRRKPRPKAASHRAATFAAPTRRRKARRALSQPS